MTTYTRPNGREVVVCDDCGVSQDGDKPDLSTLKPVDHNQGLREHLRGMGFDEASVQGVALKIGDLCPDCETKRKRAGADA